MTSSIFEPTDLIPFEELPQLPVTMRTVDAVTLLIVAGRAVAAVQAPPEPGEVISALIGAHLEPIFTAEGQLNVLAEEADL